MSKLHTDSELLVIRNAKQTANNTGYDQYVYEDTEGDFWFGRVYYMAKIDAGVIKRVVGIAKVSYRYGIREVTFIRNEGKNRKVVEKILADEDISFKIS